MAEWETRGQTPACILCSFLYPFYDNYLTNFQGSGTKHKLRELLIIDLGLPIACLCQRSSFIPQKGSWSVNIGSSHLHCFKNKLSPCSAF